MKCEIWEIVLSKRLKNFVLVFMFLVVLFFHVEHNVKLIRMTFFKFYY